MAGQDESRSVFDHTLDEVSKVSGGKPVRASHTNKMVDAINRGRRGVRSAEQIVGATTPGGSIDFAIIRGWTNGTDTVMDVSLISRNSETGAWFIPVKATVEVVCAPGLQADDYDSVQWTLDGTEVYPLELPRRIAVLAQPILTVGSELLALWLPSLEPAQDIPANVPVTDGHVVDGAGEVGFVISP